MKDSPDNALEDMGFCRERVAEFDPWYRLHIVFARQRQVNATLALNAFFAMMERAAAMTESSLCAAQLAWWNSEIEERAEVSAHPVVRALRNHGVLPVLEGSALPGLFSQALCRVQENPVSDVRGLEALCQEIGSAFVSPEVSLAKGGAASSYSGDCAGTGLWRLVHSALRNPGRGFWFVPLDLQARHGESLENIGKSVGADGSILGALAETGERWFASQLTGLAASFKADKSKARQVFASVIAQKRQLDLTLRNPEKNGRTVNRASLTEWLRLWSNVRRYTK